MAASAKPSALVFGHSFVRRFGEFIDNSQPTDLYSRDLQLVHTCEVEIFGIGGRTVDKTIRFDLNTIRGTAPNVIVLEMGSNDAWPIYGRTFDLSLMPFSSKQSSALAMRPLEFKVTSEEHKGSLYVTMMEISAR